MPFLHYETDESRKNMAEVIDKVHRDRTEAMDKMHREQMELLDHATPDELLIRGYLCHKPPLHPRRTLDQYFYHGIDTTQRDEDQVVYRYCLNNGKPPKVFMVDQLWLWVINRNLVITCFPQRWEQPKHDPFNVLDGIIEETNAKTRPPVQSVYDLAMLITNRCAGLFDRHRMDDQNYQFLEMFESSIGHVTDEESKLFVRFNRASELSGRLRRELRKEGTSLLSAPTRRSRRGGSGEEDEEEDDDDRDPADELLEIGHETELLAEIKDIRDELNILDTVLGGQYELLKDFEQHVEEELRASTAADPSARRATDMFVAECRRRSAYQGRLLETRLGDIERMDRQAQSILYSLTNLLGQFTPSPNITEMPAPRADKHDFLHLRCANRTLFAPQISSKSTPTLSKPGSRATRPSSRPSKARRSWYSRSSRSCFCPSASSPPSSPSTFPSGEPRS